MLITATRFRDEGPREKNRRFADGCGRSDRLVFESRFVGPRIRKHSDLDKCDAHATCTGLLFGFGFGDDRRGDPRRTHPKRSKGVGMRNTYTYKGKTKCENKRRCTHIQ